MNAILQMQVAINRQKQKAIADSIIVRPNAWRDIMKAVERSKLIKEAQRMRRRAKFYKPIGYLSKMKMKHGRLVGKFKKIK